MFECRLLPEGPRTHFLTRRFDRDPRGEWTQRHQTSVNGAFDGITRADLEAVGDRHLMPGSASVIDDVLRPVGRWAAHAEAAGINQSVTATIAADLERHSPK